MILAQYSVRIAWSRFSFDFKITHKFLYKSRAYNVFLTRSILSKLLLQTVLPTISIPFTSVVLFVANNKYFLFKISIDNLKFKIQKIVQVQ